MAASIWIPNKSDDPWAYDVTWWYRVGKKLDIIIF
jgi:hypothetical protein